MGANTPGDGADAAVAIVHTRGPEESVLLMRRAEREGDSWSGHWSFPGGRRDAEDADSLDTALRELEEECGIRLGREFLESALPHKVARRATAPYLVVAPYVFRVAAPLETVLEPREAAGTAWVPIERLRDPATHRLRPVPGRPREMLFPAVELDGAPLWGFTYRLITSWLELEPSGDTVESASAVLDVVLRLGVTLERTWEGREAVVRGAIPVAAAIEEFTRRENFVPGVNCVEVHADGVRIAGLGWEESRITARF